MASTQESSSSSEIDTAEQLYRTAQHYIKQVSKDWISRRSAMTQLLSFLAGASTFRNDGNKG
jgi:hypothetical protein